MKRLSYFLIPLSLMATVVVTSCNKDDDKTTLNSVDNNFMVGAAYSNQDEVAMGQLALTKSTNDSVRMFAQQMITDHTMGIMTIDSLATARNVTVPTTIDSMHAAMKARMMLLSGYSFDTAYIKGQLLDHQNAIQLYQSEVYGGNNQDIMNVASKNIPMLQMHYQRADSIATQLH